MDASDFAMLVASATKIVLTSSPVDGRVSEAAGAFLVSRFDGAHAAGDDGSDESGAAEQQPEDMAPEQAADVGGQWR